MTRTIKGTRRTLMHRSGQERWVSTRNVAMYRRHGWKVMRSRPYEASLVRHTRRDAMLRDGLFYREAAPGRRAKP